MELDREPSESSTTTTHREQCDQEEPGVLLEREGNRWATARVKERGTGSIKTGRQDSVAVLDVEEEEEGEGQHVRVQGTQETRQRYLFEKLSDVPAVRDPREVEAAERALERLAGKQPHQLSPSDRIWELAACGGSTQAQDDVPLDAESKEKIKERLHTKKLTDKTTLAF